MDVDVVKAPEPHGLDPNIESSSIPTLDGWISSLMSCKQLAESDVTRLCDRVRLPRCEPKGVLFSMLILSPQAREILQAESNVQPVVCSASRAGR